MNLNCEEFSECPQPFLFLEGHPARSCGPSFSYEPLGDVETSRNTSRACSVRAGRLCQGRESSTAGAALQLTDGDKDLLPPAWFLVLLFGATSSGERLTSLLRKLKCYFLEHQLSIKKVVLAGQGQRIQSFLYNFKTFRSPSPPAHHFKSELSLTGSVSHGVLGLLSSDLSFNMQQIVRSFSPRRKESNRHVVVFGASSGRAAVAEERALAAPPFPGSRYSRNVSQRSEGHAPHLSLLSH